MIAVYGIAFAATLAVGGIVIAYVTFPYRGHALPPTLWRAHVSVRLAEFLGARRRWRRS